MPFSSLPVPLPLVLTVLVVLVSPVRLVLLVVGRNECRGSCRGLVPRADAGRCRSRRVPPPRPVLAYRGAWRRLCRDCGLPVLYI